MYQCTFKEAISTGKPDRTFTLPMNQGNIRFVRSTRGGHSTPSGHPPRWEYPISSHNLSPITKGPDEKASPYDVGNVSQKDPVRPITLGEKGKWHKVSVNYQHIMCCHQNNRHTRKIHKWNIPLPLGEHQTKSLMFNFNHHWYELLKNSSLLQHTNLGSPRRFCEIHRRFSPIHLENDPNYVVPLTTPLPLKKKNVPNFKAIGFSFKGMHVRGIQFPSTSGETAWFQLRLSLAFAFRSPASAFASDTWPSLWNDDAHRDWKSIRDEAQEIENSEYLEDHPS